MAGTSKRIDFNELVRQAGHSIDFQVKTPETPEEIQSRLRREEAADRHERVMSVIFVASIIIVTSFCLWIIARERSTPDERKWATGLITSIVSAGLGYVTGKATARKKSGN